MDDTDLDGSHISILCSVFVLVESVFGEFSFLQIDAEFDELYHYRLKGGNRTVSRPFGSDMFV